MVVAGKLMDQQECTTALLSAALRQHLDGDLATAETLCRQIIHAHPDEPHARQYLGFLLQQTGRLQEAVEQLTVAIALDDSHAEWHFNLGITYMKQGQAALATRAFQDAIAIDPDKYFYWTNLGAAFESNGEPDQAERCYLTASGINPNCPDAFYLLSALYLTLERFEEARHFNYRGIVVSPADSHSKIVLGQAFHELGRTGEAIALFEDWLAEEPGNPVATHLLAAYRGQHAPEQCSSQYVEQTFDAFADSFENILGRLKYSGPQLVQEHLATLGIPDGSLNVLDLGCGTGLVGEKLQPYARNMVGVDLSQGMLERCSAKELYDRLYKAEIADFLRTTDDRYDLITCLDTFIYLGRLDEIFVLIHQRLRRDGILIFSTERLASSFGTAYHLNISGRYSHHPDYLSAALRAAGLRIEAMRDVTIRTESGCPIAGQFVCARRIDE